jgi:hypothetical protein
MPINATSRDSKICSGTFSPKENDMAMATRVYDDYSSALNAVHALQAAGVAGPDISILTTHPEDQLKDRIDSTDHRGEATGTGAGIGAVLGGSVGTLAGLGVMAVPGLGPIVAAGWLAAAVTGAIAGGATGGIIGAITQTGASEEEANIYAEGIRRGGTLLSVRSRDLTQFELNGILADVETDWSRRADAWRQDGWTGFDPSASPLSSDELRRERSRYR